MCTTCMAGAYGGQKWPLKLDVEVLVSCPVGAGNEPGSCPGAASVLHHWAVISTLLVLLNGSCVVCNHGSLLLNVMLYQGASVCKVPRSKPSMSDLSYHCHRRGMPNFFFLASHAIPQHTFVIKNRGHTEVHQEIILILSCCATAKSHRFWESGF